MDSLRNFPQAPETKADKKKRKVVEQLQESS